MNKERDKDVGVKISVILDLENWRWFAYPVASKEATERFNQWPLKNEQAGSMSQKAERSDAFGMPFVNPGEPMPSVKLMALMSRFVQCLRGARASIGRWRNQRWFLPYRGGNRTAVKSALEWIAEPQRRQETWERNR